MTQREIFKSLFDNFDPSEWHKDEISLPHKTLNADWTITKGNTPYDKSGSNKKKGVYFHRDYYTNEVLYIGMSLNNIGQRQSDHSYAFTSGSSRDSSGKNYKLLMEDRKLNSIKINPSYIDMSDLSDSAIVALEVAMIEYYNPVVNRK